MSLQEYLRQHYSPSTAKAYLRDIDNYLSNYPTAPQAGYKDLTTYIGALRQRYGKASTISRIVSSIKAYYSYLCHESIREDNPAAGIILKDQRTRDIQLQDLLNTEQLQSLMDRKERYRGLDCRNKVLMSLLIFQALHPGEIETLQIGDLNLEAGSMYVKGTAKTNSRTLPLKPTQILLFHQYVTEVRTNLLNGNPTGALLIGLRGEAMKAEDITKHVKRSFGKLYPGRKVSAQTIRQSVIASLLKQGHDLSIVQAFAGHRYPSATESYRQGEVETLKAAVSKYHPMQ